MTKCPRSLLVVFVLCASLASARAADTPPAPVDDLAVAKAVAASVVRVEYTLGFDKGDSPVARDWTQRCPNCGQYHNSDTQSLVNDQRPLSRAGFVLSPTRIATSDLLIHPRFIRSIAVRQGAQVVAARVTAHGVDQKTLLLTLDKPLAGATPLAFDASAPGPYRAVTYTPGNGTWTLRVASLSTDPSVTDEGRSFIAAPPGSLIVGTAGRPVALAMNDELPLDNTWKGSPEARPMITDEQMTQALGRVEHAADQRLVHVALSFRSPAAQPNDRYHGNDDDDENATERHSLGLLLNDRTLLVLSPLNPKTTARLERLGVHLPGQAPVNAVFKHSLKDYGAFVAELASPCSATPLVARDSLTPLRSRLLLAADLTLKGEHRTAYYSTARISGFDTGLRNDVFPEVPGNTEHLFLFDADAALLALPVVRRANPADNENRWRNDDPVLTPLAHLLAAVGNLPASADPNNIPLSEEEENRLAWLGVELQPLNPELARANGVSDQTEDGETGVLITHVYPDSPAAAAGIALGDVILRLHVPDSPKPIALRLDDNDPFDGAFPWDRLDEVPERYLSRIPTPWPSRSNTLARALTDIGFGKQVTIDFFRDSKLMTRTFTVTRSPASYESAPKHKSEALGLTVRELTYEVRRYFRRDASEPGVIVSRIEPGGKSATVGLKPYEVITHVNDQPVRTAKDFEAALQTPGELRLSVIRMTKGRIVKIKVDAPTSQPAGN